jgi:hypothetical protein
MVTSTGAWRVCARCSTLGGRSRGLACLSYFPPRYMQLLLDAPPLQAQLLSIVDVGLRYASFFCVLLFVMLPFQVNPICFCRYERLPTAASARTCFTRLRVVHCSLFDCILIYNLDHTVARRLSLATVHPAVQQLYQINLLQNPLYTRFLPVLERPEAQPGVPQADYEFVQGLVARSRANAPMDLPEPPRATVALAVSTTMQVAHLTTRSLMDVGTLVQRPLPNLQEPLVVTSNGQPPVGDVVRSVCLYFICTPSLSVLWCLRVFHVLPVPASQMQILSCGSYCIYALPVHSIQYIRFSGPVLCILYTHVHALGLMVSLCMLCFPVHLLPDL